MWVVHTEIPTLTHFDIEDLKKIDGNENKNDSEIQNWFYSEMDKYVKEKLTPDLYADEDLGTIELDGANLFKVLPPPACGRQDTPYSISDEILTKIKNKIGKNEFTLEINNEECLYYDNGNIYKFFYDENAYSFIIKNNNKFYIDDCYSYYFSLYNLIKIYLLRDNNNFYFCKEYYKFDELTENSTLKKEYLYEKLTKENVNKYIEPQLSLADFSLLNEYFDVDSDNELINNDTLLYLYEKEQEYPLFSEKLKRYHLSQYINSDYCVKMAIKIINKIDNNPNLERLLMVNYDSTKDLYDKMNFMEELINKNIVSLKV